MAEPLAEAGVFPGMVVQMIAVGESSGSLDAMMAWRSLLLFSRYSPITYTLTLSTVAVRKPRPLRTAALPLTVARSGKLTRRAQRRAQRKPPAA